LIVTPFRVSTQADGAVTSVDLPAMKLLEATDASPAQVDQLALEHIRRLYAGPNITHRQFVWFLSFLASHPSDHAVRRAPHGLHRASSSDQPT
jgi:hypothetical protein